MSSGPLIIGAGEAPALRPQGPIEPAGASSSRRAMRAARGLLSDRRVAVPFAGVVALVLFAIFAPILWGDGPDKQDLLHSLESPSWSHPMGTDQLGRDVFARV